MYFVSPHCIVAQQKETYPDHCEDNADGAEDGLRWCDARETFRDIQALDDHVQRGEDIFSTFRSFGFCVHGSKVGVGTKEVVTDGLWGRCIDPDWDERQPPVSTALPELFSEKAAAWRNMIVGQSRVYSEFAFVGHPLAVSLCSLGRSFVGA